MTQIETNHPPSKVQNLLGPEWFEQLEAQFAEPYMRELSHFLRTEIAQGKNIFPSSKNYFRAFALTPFSQVKVVILGQDPYHGVGQAHGLSFSVQAGVAAPPSLVNIYKELHQDMGLPIPAHGCLEAWAKQGVLLLNSVLTVESGKAASHRKHGWEKFTDHVVGLLNEQKHNLVFILWGSDAQKKAAFVDRKKHLVLESVHPSPLSVYRGFFGSKPFSKTNTYLQQHGLTPIDWSL